MDTRSETYVGAKSDYYTHCHDLPPQIGRCIVEADGVPFADEIDGKDGDTSSTLDIYIYVLMKIYSCLVSCNSKLLIIRWLVVYLYVRRVELYFSPVFNLCFLNICFYMFFLLSLRFFRTFRLN